MNYIDMFAILVLVLGILIGYNQGFLKSMFNIVNIILSVLIGLVFYGVVAKNITSNPQIIPTVIHFSEASELLGGIENESISVYEKSFEEIQILIKSLNMPYPLDELLEKNVENQAFASKGIEKLGDYLGQTIGSMSVNYISFVIVFAISFGVLIVLISMADYILKFPVMRSMDAVAGGIGGLLQGFLLLNVIFLAVPLVLTFLPFDELAKFVDGSSFSGLYYYHHLIIKILRGVI